jgi:hypothetical protein
LIAEVIVHPFLLFGERKPSCRWHRAHAYPSDKFGSKQAAALEAVAAKSSDPCRHRCAWGVRDAGEDACMAVLALSWLGLMNFL